MSFLDVPLRHPCWWRHQVSRNGYGTDWCMNMQFNILGNIGPGAWQCGRVERGPYKNDRGPIYLRMSRASKVSKKFIMWNSAQTCLFIFPAFENRKHSLWPWKRSVWQIPNRIRNNKNAQIYLETNLPYYTIFRAL